MWVAERARSGSSRTVSSDRSTDREGEEKRGGQFILVTRFTGDWAKGGAQTFARVRRASIRARFVLLVASSAGFPAGQGRSVTPAYPFLCGSGAAYPVVKQRGLEVCRARSVSESEQLVCLSTKCGVDATGFPTRDTNNQLNHGLHPLAGGPPRRVRSSVLGCQTASRRRPSLVGVVICVGVYFAAVSGV